MEYTGGGHKPEGGENELPSLIPPLQHPSSPPAAAAAGSPAVPASMGMYNPAYHGPPIGHGGRGSPTPMIGYSGGGGGHGGHSGGDQGSVSLLGHNVPLSNRTLAAPSGPRPPSLRTQAAEQFIIRVEREFANKANEYLEFQGVLLQYFFGCIDKRGVVDRMQVVLRGHPDLIRSFNAFMPRGYELNIEVNQPGGGAGDA